MMLGQMVYAFVGLACFVVMLCTTITSIRRAAVCGYKDQDLIMTLMTTAFCAWIIVAIKRGL